MKKAHRFEAVVLLLGVGIFRYTVHGAENTTQAAIMMMLSRFRALVEFPCKVRPHSIQGGCKWTAQVLCVKGPDKKPHQPNIGALIIRIGFWGPRYSSIIRNPPKIVLVIIRAPMLDKLKAPALLSRTGSESAPCSNLKPAI